MNRIIADGQRGGRRGGEEETEGKEREGERNRTHGVHEELADEINARGLERLDEIDVEGVAVLLQPVENVVGDLAGEVADGELVLVATIVDWEGVEEK